MQGGNRQQNINQLKFWNSQIAQQRQGLPGWATVGGEEYTPASAAAAGATPAQAAQFGKPPAGAPPSGVPPGATPGGVPPGGVPPSPLNRQQRNQAIHQNIAALKLTPPPQGKGPRGILQALQNIPATPGQPPQTSARLQAKLIAREVGRYMRSAGNGTANYLDTLPIPGGVWTPVLILLVLLFVLVPIKGADGKSHTRLGWMWMAILGQAHIENEQLITPTPATTQYNNPFALPPSQSPSICSDTLPCPQGYTCILGTCVPVATGPTFPSPVLPGVPNPLNPGPLFPGLSTSYTPYTASGDIQL